MLTLVLFHYLDKNPGWVQIMVGMRSIMMTTVMNIRSVSTSQPSPCVGASMRGFISMLYLLFETLCQLKIRYVINSVMIHLCNLSAHVCDFAWARMGFMHPLLFLKLGVTVMMIRSPRRRTRKKRRGALRST